MASVDFGSKRIAPPASLGKFGSRHPPQGGRQATQADCGAIDTVLLNGETVVRSRGDRSLLTTSASNRTVSCPRVSPTVRARILAGDRRGCTKAAGASAAVPRLPLRARPRGRDPAQHRPEHRPCRGPVGPRSALGHGRRDGRED